MVIVIVLSMFRVRNMARLAYLILTVVKVQVYGLKKTNISCK